MALLRLVIVLAIFYLNDGKADGKIIDIDESVIPDTELDVHMMDDFSKLAPEDKLSQILEEMAGLKARIQRVEESENTLIADDNSLTQRMAALDERESRIEAAVTELDQRDPPQDCADILRRHPDAESGIYEINIGVDHRTSQFIDVYCDMVTDGGGWLVFQRRQNGNINFYRDYASYADGFGNMNGEFWLGNNLFRITSRRNYGLRVDLADFNGDEAYAKYTSFSVGSSCDGYVLNVAGFHGNAEDSLTHHSGNRFSTRDRDQDASSRHCAELFRGAWWYRDCFRSNLNGQYLGDVSTPAYYGIHWIEWRGNRSLKFSAMMIRPETISCK